MIEPRFVRAVNNIRPYGAHRYDLFGPKIGRRLRLFGRLALDLWVRLESDPRVVTYCERPLCIPDAKPSRVVDLGVRTHDDERLCVVLGTAEWTSVEPGGSLFPAFQSWSRSSSLQLQMIHPKELDDPQVLRDNRVMMLCYLAGTHALPVKELIRACSPCVKTALRCQNSNGNSRRPIRCSLARQYSDWYCAVR